MAVLLRSASRRPDRRGRRGKRHEEVNFAASPDRGLGANFGWNRFEALHTYPGGALVTPPFPAGFTFPLLEKSHSGDGVCSIIGGYVVRDPALPELAGQYIYGDFCNPELRAVSLTGSGTPNDHGLGLNVNYLNSFGEDACARVYVASYVSGTVDRLSNGANDTCTTPVPTFPGAPAVSVSDAGATEGDNGSRPRASSSASPVPRADRHRAPRDGERHRRRPSGLHEHERSVDVRSGTDIEDG